jgi:putative membrane protein
MPGILLRWIITTLAIMVVPHIIPGVRVEGIGTALAAAAILGILNALVRPILIILTLPLTVVTLGVFILVINALLFELAGVLVSGFHIASFWSALFGSLVVSLVSWVISFGAAGESREHIIWIRRGSAGGSIDMRRGTDGKWE